MNQREIVRKYMFMAETIMPTLSASEQVVLNQFFAQSVLLNSDIFSIDVQRLARKSGNMSLVALRRAVAGLVQKGFIAILSKGQSHRATEYKLLIEQQPSEPLLAQQIASDAKSKLIGLEFPYDWSNTNMNDDTLIESVLRKARFMDVLKICGFYGIPKVESMAERLADRRGQSEIKRILSNIKAGRRTALGIQPNEA